jgi:IclR family pca regulon transcriptional regulator
LLAGLPDEEIERYLQHATLKRLTSATVVNPQALKAKILKARKQGHAWVDGELDESIAGLAVPVRDQDGETIAALNVSLPSGEFTCDDALARFLPDLRQAASRLRAAARY